MAHTTLQLQSPAPPPTTSEGEGREKVRSDERVVGDLGFHVLPIYFFYRVISKEAPE